MKKSTVVFAIVSCFTVLLAASGCSAGGKAEKTASSPNAEELTIYVVRHGQTIFNLMDKVQGISDGVLTKKGITGAVNMGKGLRGVQFNAVYSSDLKRAIETARLAMEQNLATKQWAIAEKKELREVSFGIFEGDPNWVMYAAFAKHLGLSLPEDAKSIGAATAPIVKYYNSDMKKFLEGLADFNKEIDSVYKISEDASEVYARLKKGMDEITGENPNGGNVMLVAHGQSISFLLAAIGVEVSGQLGNSSVTKLVYNYASKTYAIDGPVGDMSYAEAGAAL
ncbi:MAG: histidine phosphatase family protein [Spirochaetaceae bacterium]|jgi:probable phosphoglycerate mutase|nr:histidine phosphatase family protein [Spirochaetaceae bacterium]